MVGTRAQDVGGTHRLPRGWVDRGVAQEAPPSLYERLGGLAPISVVVSDCIEALAADEVLNANSAIDAARKRVPAPYLKYHVTALVCQVTGGPYVYHGRGMKEAHAHLNITKPNGIGWSQSSKRSSRTCARTGC